MVEIQRQFHGLRSILPGKWCSRRDKKRYHDIVRMKFHKHLKHIASDGHAYMGALWFFNEARRKLFPRAHQHFLFDGLQPNKTTTCALLTRNQVPAYEDFKKGRGSIFVPTPLEKAAFKTAAAPIMVGTQINLG